MPALHAQVTALADEASIEIARFDAEMGNDIAPFTAILLRSESAASSQIEHLTASPRAIALAEIGDTRRRNASEIVANTRAMAAAVELAHRLDAGAILAMQRALMEQTHPELAGRWRDEQVWIGGSGLGPLVLLLARASVGAIGNGRLLVADLRAARQEWSDAVRARRDSAVWRVLDLLLRQPVVDSATLHRELGIPVGNASRYLVPLEEAGVVVEFSGQHRNRLWRADAVLDALEAFAARSTRRTLG